jgi:drug/metabolite transporter (DMT)-like permease
VGTRATTAPALVVRDELSAYVGLGLATMGWAIAFVVGKLVLTGMTPLAVGVWRYAMAGAILVPFALRDATRRRLPDVVVPLAIMTATGGVIYPWLFLEALARTSATNTSLLIALNPVFTVLLAPLVVGEALTRRKAAGLVLALAGAVIVITRGDLGLVARLGFAIGDLMAVVAAAMWAVFNLASRRVVGLVSPSVINCVIYSISGVVLFTLGFSDSPVAQLAGASASIWVGIFAMAMVSSVIAGQFFLSGVRVVGVSRAVVFVYLVPVLTAVLASLVLDERFTAAQAIGGVLVLVGVGLASRIEGPRWDREAAVE